MFLLATQFVIKKQEIYGPYQMATGAEVSTAVVGNRRDSLRHEYVIHFACVRTDGIGSALQNEAEVRSAQ